MRRLTIGMVGLGRNEKVVDTRVRIVIVMRETRSSHVPLPLSMARPLLHEGCEEKRGGL